MLSANADTGHIVTLFFSFRPKKCKCNINDYGTACAIIELVYRCMFFLLSSLLLEIYIIIFLYIMVPEYNAHKLSIVPLKMI